MAEYKKPTSEEDFKKNFKQKKPLMNNTEAYYESSRCLFCYDAPCIKACPTHIDIPLFIKQIQTQNTEGSAKTIFDANWLGNACGVVCPTEVLCEGSCVFNLDFIILLILLFLFVIARSVTTWQSRSLMRLPHFEYPEFAVTYYHITVFDVLLRGINCP